MEEGTLLRRLFLQSVRLSRTRRETVGALVKYCLLLYDVIKALFHLAASCPRPPRPRTKGEKSPNST